MKPLKYILTGLFSLLLFLCIHAQEQVHFSRLLLKGGNSLYGTLESNADPGCYAFRLPGADSLIQIPAILVEKIVVDKNAGFRLASGKIIPTQGWYGSASLHFTAAQSDYEWDNSTRQALGVQLEAGYLLKPWLAVGAGISTDYYEEEWLVPVYGSLRISNTRRTQAPYFNLQVGQGIAVQRLFNREQFDISRAGILVAPTVGFRIASRRKTAFFIETGYKFQRHTIHYDYPDNITWWGVTEEKQTYLFKSFIVKTGITF
ncbi:MAG: hypothetical protein R2795_25865 [Saprospiraceae bacterium]